MPNSLSLATRLAQGFKFQNEILVLSKHPPPPRCDIISADFLKFFIFVNLEYFVQNFGKSAPFDTNTENKRLNPSLARFFSTSAHNNLRLAATAAAMLECERRVRLERKATAASGLQGELRWERLLVTFHTWSLVRP